MRAQDDDDDEKWTVEKRGGEKVERGETEENEERSATRQNRGEIEENREHGSRLLTRRPLKLIIGEGLFTSKQIQILIQI